MWIALLLVLAGYVVADFARTPFLASSGSAAVRPAQLTLWVPAPAGAEVAKVVNGAAAGMTLAGHPAVVKQLSGGTSQAVSAFLAQPPREPGAAALVITSGTLADLAHDRRERLVPGAAEQSALATAMLEQAAPLAILATEPLAIAVPDSSPVHGPEQLLSSLRTDPGAQLFGITDDTWSRSQLAALVSSAGVVGHARFRVFQSGTEAGRAAARGAATTVLTDRGAVREDLRAGRLRQVAWPFDGGRAPRSWIALVAPPGESSHRVDRLRRWVGALLHERRWRQLLREEGQRPGRAGGARLSNLLRAGTVEADRLELIARRVERG